MTENHKPKPQTEPQEKIRILLVDDHAQTREVLREVIDTEPRFSIVAEAAGGEEGLALAKTCRPDIILMDVSMDGMNGIEAARRLHETGSESEIIMLSNYVNLTLVEAAFAAGVRGYISKQTAAEELNPGIRAVSAGDTYVCSRIAQRMV